MLDLEKYAPSQEQLFLGCGEAKSWGEELVFEKFLSVESILSQIFAHVQFSCVFLTDQIFMSILFHSAYGQIKP